jgi:hypothetical protein
VQVLQSAGFDVWKAESLDELGRDLQCEEQVDAVVLSEDDRQTTLRAAEVVRQHSGAPLILFRRSQADLDERQFDRVFSFVVPPHQWVSETAALINLSRRIRALSERVNSQSAHLRRQCRTAVEKSQRQRARSRVELQRDVNLGEPWQLDDSPSAQDEDIDQGSSDPPPTPRPSPAQRAPRAQTADPASFEHQERSTLAVAIQATQSTAWGVSPCVMDQDEQLILATESLVTQARRRTEMAWVTAAGLRTSAEQSKARIHETRCRLDQTASLCQSLTVHKRGRTVQTPC